MLKPTLTKFIVLLVITILGTACAPGQIRQGTSTPDSTEQETAVPTTESTTPEPDPTETDVPSPTETAEPPSESTHTWDAQPVLIAMQDTPGFVSPDYAWGIAPELIIYADGTVIYSTWGRSGDNRGPTYWQYQLSQSELCNVLNDIDSFGFFDLERDEYVPPTITDSETTVINVNTWKSNIFRAYSLSYAVIADDEEIVLPSALADTYNLLISLKPEDAAPYAPESVSILVGNYDYDIPTQPWPLSEPDLSELSKDIGQYEQKEFVFEGQTAADLTGLFEGSLTNFYEANGLVYGVTIRPLFPYEIYEANDGWGRISEFETTPITEMTCNE